MGDDGGFEGDAALIQWLSPQLVLFISLFGASLYFMCHIDVGLDQELALPKVSPLASQPLVL